jgi:hypothetical protein
MHLNYTTALRIRPLRKQVACSDGKTSQNQEAWSAQKFFTFSMSLTISRYRQVCVWLHRDQLLQPGLVINPCVSSCLHYDRMNSFNIANLRCSRNYGVVYRQPVFQHLYNLFPCYVSILWTFFLVVWTVICTTCPRYKAVLRKSGVIIIISFYSLVEYRARVKIRHLVLFAAKAFTPAQLSSLALIRSALSVAMLF